MQNEMQNNEVDHQPQHVTFTLDEDFNELHDKDETTELTGFVDEVRAPAIVGSKTKYDLFKFVLNNGGTKLIMILVWGRDLIDKFVNDVKIGQIIHIEGGVTKSIALNFYKESNNFVPFEILIKDVTTIDFLGQHIIPEHRPIYVNHIQDVNFETIGKSRGLTSIQGYLKMKFVKSLHKYKQVNYGCGSITDGNLKVTVHISNYTGLEIAKGALIKVIGEIDEGAGPITIICRDDTGVILIPGAEVMEAGALARGVKSPKRGLN